MPPPQMDREGARIKSALDAQGYVALRAWRPGVPADVLAAEIGPVERIRGIPLVQVLTSKPREASSPNLYSGNFGWDMFPLHTDLAHWFVPPRYFMLRCVQGDPRALTALVPWSQALNEISETDIALARFRPRKSVRGRIHLLPFQHELGGTVLHRWDSVFLVPDNDAARRVARVLTGRQEEGTRHALEKAGDTLIVDNWRVLHGRSAVAADSRRMIERVYIREINFDG